MSSFLWNDNTDMYSPPGAGYDQVDVSACTARGIRVSHVPTAVDDATADTNMFLILGALRGFNAGMCALRESQWRGNPLPRLGHDPQGKTLGILGMGGIGRNVRDKALAFGMTVQYHNRKKLNEEVAGRATYVEFDELLSTSDVISLNLPLNVNSPTWTSFFPAMCGQLNVVGWAGQDKTHHLRIRIRQDERRRRDRQHRERSRHGRGSARASARQRESVLVRSGRV